MWRLMKLKELKKLCNSLYLSLYHYHYRQLRYWRKDLNGKVSVSVSLLVAQSLFTFLTLRNISVSHLNIRSTFLC
jgi:hypothetical protein